MNNAMKWTVAVAVTAALSGTIAFAQQAETLEATADTSVTSDSVNAASEAKEAEVRYVTDLIYTPIRTGPGGDYRIVNKGLPSGTEITYFGTSDDGIWAEVETRGGTRGYVRAQYLQIEIPRAKQVNALEKELVSARTRAYLYAFACAFVCVRLRWACVWCAVSARALSVCALSVCV